MYLNITFEHFTCTSQHYNPRTIRFNYISSNNTSERSCRRQQEKVHAEAAKMIPDTKARLTKAAEELRELMVSLFLLHSIHVYSVYHPILTVLTTFVYFGETGRNGINPFFNGRIQECKWSIEFILWTSRGPTCDGRGEWSKRYTRGRFLIQASQYLQ